MCCIAERSSFFSYFFFFWLHDKFSIALLLYLASTSSVCTAPLIMFLIYKVYLFHFFFAFYSVTHFMLALSFITLHSGKSGSNATEKREYIRHVALSTVDSLYASLHLISTNPKWKNTKIRNGDTVKIFRNEYI